MSPNNATLIGRVVFIDGKLGGRKTPVGSGYRGQFFYNGMDCDAVHTFEVQGSVPFGQEVIDYIYLPNPNHLSQIKEGMIFLVREGPHTVGYGQIIQVNQLASL
jgi:translation elongation factor EF-Tu-like GTPase